MNALITTDSIVRAMARMDTKQPRAKSTAMVATSTTAMERILQQGKPGGWASDHRAEADRYTGWNFVAVSAIAKAVQMAEVNAYTWQEEEPREKPEIDAENNSVRKSYAADIDKGEPFSRKSPLMMMLRRPNPKQSGASFRYEQAMQLSLTGTCLVWNVPNIFGKVVRRYVIPTATAEPCSPNPQYPDGYWRVSPESTRWGNTSTWYWLYGVLSSIDFCIDANEIQAIRWPHPIFKDDGYSTISAVASWTDQSEQIERSRCNNFRNGYRPSVVISMDEWTGTQDEFDRLKAQMNAEYASVDNNGKIHLVSGIGTRVDILDKDVHEMDYTQSSEELRDSILAGHGVPGAAVGLVSPTGREGVYAPLLQFSKNLEPLLTLMAEEDNEYWVWQYGTDAYVEYLPQRVDDPEQDRADLNLLLTAKAITKGELRQRMGLDLFGDERDDEIAGTDPAAQEMMMMGGGMGGFPPPPAGQTGPKPPAQGGFPKPEDENSGDDLMLKSLGMSVGSGAGGGLLVPEEYDVHVKHTPGGHSHDQKRHGSRNGASGASAGERAASIARKLRQMAADVTARITGSGYSRRYPDDYPEIYDAAVKLVDDYYDDDPGHHRMLTNILQSHFPVPYHAKHMGPGSHPGTGSSQQIHGGGGAGGKQTGINRVADELADELVCKDGICELIRSQDRTSVNNPHRVDPRADADHDGVTDAARVGVPSDADPNKIPRMANLTKEERAVEERFASAYEADPEGMTAKYDSMVRATAVEEGEPLLAKTYNADDAKLLSEDYRSELKNRSKYNIAVHQTAHAIAKQAFIKRLDELKSLPEDQRYVLITQGGVAAGKGHALRHNEQMKRLSNSIGAVWDAAGEQNGTDMDWIQDALNERGLTGIYAFVAVDPINHKHAGINGVLGRATKKGRMVDVRLFAESYEIGAQNFLNFKAKLAREGRANAKFVILHSDGPQPKVVNEMPRQATAEAVYAEAKRRLIESDLPNWVKLGGLIGERVWDEAGEEVSQ
jgi:hypothetical protein